MYISWYGRSIGPARSHAALAAGCALVLMPIAEAAQADSSSVPPPASIVTQGVPAVPQSLADVIDRYTQYRAARLLSWRPGGGGILIATRFAETPQVHAVASPGAARRQLTFGHDAIAGAAYPPTRSDYFLFEHDRDGNEQYQYYRFDLRTKSTTLLTDGRSRNTGLVFSHKGDRVAYGSTRRNGADVDLYVMNPDDRKSDHMLTGLSGGGWAPLDWSPDESRILLMEYVSADESYLWLVDAKTGAKTRLTDQPGGAHESIGTARFSRRSNGIYLTTDRDCEFRQLEYLDLATGKYLTLTASIPWDIDVLALSRDGRYAAYVANRDGIAELHILDTASHHEVALPRLPPGQVSGLVWNPDSRELGLTLISARSAGDAYSLDVRSGAVHRWTYSEPGDVNVGDLPEPKLVHWQSFDGRAIAGFLHEPPARFTGRRPVMVLIHGGPESQARPTFMGAYNYVVEDLGVAIIEPNVRGSTGYGKSFQLLDNGSLREGSYKDIGALLDWIAIQPELDPDRVMISGGSYGGHMTLAISTLYSDRIRCSKDMFGMSNLVTFLEHTSAYRRDLRRAEYGDEREPQMRAFLERIAPMNNAERIRKPILIVAGGEDPRVPLSESVQMVERVRGAGTPVWFLEARDEGHGFLKKHNRDYDMYTTVLFMKQYLLN